MPHPAVQRLSEGWSMLGRVLPGWHRANVLHGAPLPMRGVEQQQWMGFVHLHA